MSSFIQKLNPLSGLNEWVLQDENYDYHQEVARAAFADMLHDQERNDMYEEGIRAAIQHMHKRGMKANVLDIGTGTGLLSMMAVRHGADSVVACEAFKPMSECASNILKLNQLENRIQLISERSTNIEIGKHMQHKANILVAEVFDTELIGEGALGTFQHAHEHLLEKDCVVVPHSATIYAQVIESPLLVAWNRLKDVYNADGELILKAPVAVKHCQGTANLHDVQLSQIPKEFIKFITNPQPVFRFDFSGQTPFVFQRSAVNVIKTTQHGSAQGVFMWWELNMDVDNKRVLSCAPYWTYPKNTESKDIPWRDHWMQAIYYFPKELTVAKDDEISLISSHDEYSLWFNIKKDIKVNNDDYKPPICDCNLHTAYCRTRIGQLNDAKRTKKFVNLIHKQITQNDVVLILSQGFYAALIAAKQAKKVYFMEMHQLPRRLTTSFIEENHLTNVEIIEESWKFDGDEQINVVLAEPYYMSSIVPWDNLLFLTLLKRFEKNFAKDCRIYPQQAKIYALGMQFDNLHKIRAPLGKCNGFEMKPFDQLIEQACENCDNVVEAQPLWEYPGIAVTHQIEIAHLDLNVLRNAIKKEEKDIKFDILKGYRCNGVAVWVDWILDSDETQRSTITTGPVHPVEVGEYVQWDMHIRQGVCLLGNADVSNGIRYNFTYDFERQSHIELTRL